MISKELLEEVLGERYIPRLGMEINTYELAHMCKEWAIRKEYQILSGFADRPAYRKANEKCYARLMWKNKQHEDSDMYFITETEPEATFLACEWILENDWLT